MLLVVDNGSIYTKNLTNFLSNTKINFKNLPFYKVQTTQLSKFDSIILSGRRKNNREMNSLNSHIINLAKIEKKPLLGICYGAEILALTLGGTIRKTSSFLKGEQEITVTKDNPLCEGKIKVFESHNYEISRLGNFLVSIAKSEDCRYEIVKQKSANIFGTQFHPEMSRDGQSIIEAFISI